MKTIRLIDTRPFEIFEKKYLKDAVNIPLGDEFIYWLTLFVDNRKPSVFMCAPEKEELLRHLLRDLNYLYAELITDNGLNAVTDYDTIKSYDSYDFNFLCESGEYIVIDLRRPLEVNYRFNNAVNLSLEQLLQAIGMFNPTNKYLVYCVNGYRSMMACSILKANGINNVYNLEKGIEETKVLLPEVLLVD